MIVATPSTTLACIILPSVSLNVLPLILNITVPPFTGLSSLVTFTENVAGFPATTFVLDVISTLATDFVIFIVAFVIIELYSLFPPYLAVNVILDFAHPFGTMKLSIIATPSTTLA